MSQCELRLKSLQASIKRCSQITALQPTKAKVLFVRGKAFSAFGDTDDALESILKTTKIDPSTADVCNRKVKILGDRKK